MRRSESQASVGTRQSFNREWEESSRLQRRFSVPDAELREALKRDNKQALLPRYSAFYELCVPLSFSKNMDKYVKYTPVQVSILHAQIENTLEKGDRALASRSWHRGVVSINKNTLFMNIIFTKHYERHSSPSFPSSSYLASASASPCFAAAARSLLPSSQCCPLWRASLF